jgi:hypothetical protein
LLTVFHREDSKIVIDEICSFFISAIHKDSRMRRAYREVGILDIIVKIILHLSRKFANLSRIKPSAALDFSPSLIQNYGSITDLLVLLLEDSENQIYFRRDVGRDIYDCLLVHGIQIDTLKVIRVFLIFFLKIRPS